MERRSTALSQAPEFRRQSIASRALRIVLAGLAFGCVATAGLTILTLFMVTSDGNELGDIVWPQYFLLAAWYHLTPMTLLGIVLAAALAAIRGLVHRVRLAVLARRAA